MKTTLSLFFLTASYGLAHAQPSGYGLPAEEYPVPVYPTPAVVYQAPVAYEGTVIYQAPVIYNAPVYYITSESSNWRSSWERDCAMQSTVTVIGGGHSFCSYSPCYDNGSTLTIIGRGFRH
jgi:hypothetical protein